MTFEKNIPNATAKRLSLYYRIFKRFHRENIDKQALNKLLKRLGLILLLLVVTSPILVS